MPAHADQISYNASTGYHVPYWPSVKICQTYSKPTGTKITITFFTFNQIVQESWLRFQRYVD